jgi:hypothetical protein
LEAFVEESLAETSYITLRLKAEAALLQLLSADSTPPNVRAAAVRTALELVGAIGVRSKDQDSRGSQGLEPEGLTLETIDREIDRLGEV